MRENDFCDALEQVKLSAQAQQRIIEACAAYTAPATASGKRMFTPIAIAAAIVLLLAGGALLPGMLAPDYSFTITAYALDASGETVSAELSAENISFEFDSNPYSASSGGFGSGGETNAAISFSCVGENIKSITYTAEDCRLAYRIFVDDYEQWYSWAKDGNNIVDGSWTGLTEKGPGRGEIVFGLGESYTVDYANQQDKNYLLRLPLYAIDGDYQGEYPVVMRTQMQPPSGIAHSAQEYTQRLVTSSHIVKEAYITVTVTFTDGTSQQKLLLLTPLKHPELSTRDVGFDWYIIRIEVVE